MFEDTSNKANARPAMLTGTNVPSKLTPRDIALGIGRKATDEELEEYLSRPYGKSIPLRQAVTRIKEKLQKKHAKILL